MRAYNFGANWCNLTKLFHVTCHKACMTTWVLIFWPYTRNIWEGEERPKFGEISDNC